MQALTRKDQKEKTRLGLVQAAEQLFSEVGISATTTAHIAKALKVSHGTVFIHFPTRDDLVLAVVDRFGERLSEQLGKRLSENLPLKELLRAHYAVLSEFEDFYLRLLSEGPQLPGQIRSLIHAMNASISYRIYRAAQTEMREGRIKKMGQAAFFNTWLSLLHYHIQNRDLFSENTPVLNQIGEDLLRHFQLLIKN